MSLQNCPSRQSLSLQHSEFPQSSPLRSIAQWQRPSKQFPCPLHMLPFTTGHPLYGHTSSAGGHGPKRVCMHACISVSARGSDSRGARLGCESLLRACSTSVHCCLSDSGCYHACSLAPFEGASPTKKQYFVAPNDIQDRARPKRTTHECNTSQIMRGINTVANTSTAEAAGPVVPASMEKF